MVLEDGQAWLSAGHHGGISRSLGKSFATIEPPPKSRGMVDESVEDHGPQVDVVLVAAMRSGPALSDLTRFAPRRVNF